MSIDRRAFIFGAAGSTLSLSSFAAAAKPRRSGPINLVPSRPSGAPNYFSTWGVQNWRFYMHAKLVDDANFLKDTNPSVEAQLNEATLLGSVGWAARFHRAVRGDLFLVLDEGWQQGDYANFEINRSRFPSFTGAPLAQITKINRDIRALGWRGTGLWCRNTKGGNADVSAVQTMKDAGISYCKLDQGDNLLNFIRVRDELKAPLVIEHVLIEGPLNGRYLEDGRFKMDERFPAWSDTVDTTYPRGKVLDGTDVYRIYDLTSFLGLPTALDRTGQMLAHIARRPEVKTLLNAEDEVYVAAALGCTMGVMRHPETAVRPDGIEDYSFVGPRNARRRMDEVVRALHWQRIAPPYSGGNGFVRLDEEILTDSWKYGPFETWYYKAYGKLVHQGAPARISRDMELPRVDAKGEKPFVFASRFPNGAVAIGAQQRTLEGRAWFMPEASVRLDVVRQDVPIGIFGHFSELALTFDGSLRGKRVFAQDLKSDRAIDVTRQISIGANSMTLTKEFIERVGLSAATPGDLSSPGLVIKLFDE